MQAADLEKPSERKALRYLGVATLAVPILLFVLVTLRTSVNIPFEDDYDGIGEFIEHYVSLHGAAARLWWVLTAQHVQYKDMVMQTVVALQYQCIHRINYQWLQLCGNLSELATVVVLWFIFARSARPLTQRIWLFSVPCFLYLGLRYADTVNWAMTNLQGPTVILFAALTALLATSTRRKIMPWFLLSLALTIASSVNGFLIVPVLLFLFLYARRFREASYTVAVTLAMGALYAWHYTLIVGSDVPSPHGVKSLIGFPFAFLGAGTGAVHSALVVGVVLVAGFAFLTLRGWLRVCPASFGLALFSLLTACLVAAGRFRLGLEAAIPGRYAMYTALLASLEYIAAVRLFAPRTLRRGSPWFLCLGAAGVGAFLFCLLADLRGYQLLRDRKERLTTHLILWERHPDHLVLVPDEGIAEQQPGFVRTRIRFQQDMQREVAAGLYIPPYTAADPLPVRTHSPSSQGIENERP
ncbi:MAG TPA: hypothetical protein VGU25_10180 [Acidobacteriaceae bacterium]|nr:hypothetical protein [Acidobacteriaceae bacterium]